VPDKPYNVITTLSAPYTNTIVTWDVNPSVCGWPIDGCYVEIMRTEYSAGGNTYVTYPDATQYCAEVMPLVGIGAGIQRYVPSPQNVCSLPLSTLESNIFNIQDSDSIWARVTCCNAMGCGPVSDPGNNAINPRAPDAVSYFQCFGQTTDSITVTWTPGNDYGFGVTCYIIDVVVYGTASTINNAPQYDAFGNLILNNN
jgi:hypothetical protein